MSYQLKQWDSKRERKLPAVRRTKGLSKSREELAGYGPAQPHRRQEGGEGKGACSAPRTAAPTTLQTGLQSLTKDLLRFWMVDIRREGRSEAKGTGGDWGWGRGGQKARRTGGECARQTPGCLSLSDREGTKRRRSFLFQAFVEHPRAGTARSTGPTPYRAAGSLSSVEGKAAPAPPRSPTEPATRIRDHLRSPVSERKLGTEQTSKQKPN